MQHLPLVTKIQQFSGHLHSVYALTRGRNPETFFSGSADGIVAEWNLRSHEKNHAVLRSSNPVYSLLYVAEKNYLFVGLNNGDIQIIDLEKNVLAKSISIHKGPVFDMQLQPDGTKIIAVGGEGLLSIWSTETLECLSTIKISDQRLRAVAFHPDGSQFAVGSNDQKIRVFATSSLEKIAGWEAHASSVFTLEYDHQGNFLYSGGKDARLKKWDAHLDYMLSHEVNAHFFSVNHLLFSPDHAHLATASRDKTIRLWKADDLSLLKVVDKYRRDGHVASVNKLLWISPEELLSGEDDKTILDWKIEF